MLIDFERLDKRVKDYTIFDYKTILSTTSTGSYFYINYQNIYDTNSQTLDILNWSGSAIIVTQNWLNNSILKIYKKDKLFLSKVVDRSSDYSFDFDDASSFKVTWTNSWEILNTINLTYFSEDNIYPEKNDMLELIEINQNEDKSWTNINHLEIINIWWTKKIIWDWVEYDSVHVFFENNSKQSFIKIEK